MEDLQIAVCEDLLEEQQRLLTMIEKSGIPQAVPPLKVEKLFYRITVPENMI